MYSTETPASAGAFCVMGYSTDHASGYTQRKNPGDGCNRPGAVAACVGGNVCSVSAIDAGR